MLIDLAASCCLPVMEGRQAMHELDVGVAGFPADIHVDLVRLGQADALLPYRLVLPHRHPDLGEEEVAPLDAPVAAAADAQPPPALLRHPPRVPPPRRARPPR